jgi:hypothetical protein
VLHSCQKSDDYAQGHAARATNPGRGRTLAPSENETNDEASGSAIWQQLLVSAILRL